MKRLCTFTAVLLSACLAFPAVQVSAYKPDPEDPANETQCGDNIFWEYDGQHTLTLKGSGRMWDCQAAPKYSADVFKIVVESGIEYIGNEAFEFYDMLDTVVMADTVTAIGDRAFSECVNLQSITLSENLTEIGDEAFFLTSIESLTLPDSVRTLGASAFACSEFLTSIGLPDGLTAIGDSCFAYCTSLTDIRIPDHLESIGSGILDGCREWYDLNAQDTVLFSGFFLYRYFGSDTDIVIPETVTALDAHCFCTTDFSKFRNINGYTRFGEQVARTDIRSVTLPDTVTQLPEGLFSRMTGLESVCLGSRITEIPTELCAGCTALTSVNIPDSVLKIGGSAFYQCSALAEITVPEKVSFIGEAAFQNTAWLEQAEGFVTVGDGLLYACRSTDKTVNVPDGVKTICAYAFRDAGTVTVTLPDSVTEILPAAFRSNTLVSVTLGAGITELPDGAVQPNVCFEQIVIPETVTQIGDQAVQTSADFVIIGKKGSAAEMFAKKYARRFAERIAAPEGPDLALDHGTECWSFANSSSVFGSKNYLSDDDKALLSQIISTGETDWSGSCFGMCVSVILAKAGVFSAQTIDPDADSLAALRASKPVQSMINYYQAMQAAPVFRTYNVFEELTQTVYRIIRTAAEIPHGAPPILLCFETKTGQHAAVGYASETGSWSYEDRTWTHRIRLYDPNVPTLQAARCFYYDPETLAFCIPHYGLYYDGGIQIPGLRLRACNDISVLDAYPYPFAERFSDGGPAGDVNGDGQLSADDARLLLQFLLTETTLPDDALRRADLSGDRKVNAADLTLLKRLLLT